MHLQAERGARHRAEVAPLAVPATQPMPEWAAVLLALAPHRSEECRATRARLAPVVLRRAARLLSVVTHLPREPVAYQAAPTQGWAGPWRLAVVAGASAAPSEVLGRVLEARLH
jgi:hypothetical protein